MFSRRRTTRSGPAAAALVLLTIGSIRADDGRLVDPPTGADQKATRQVVRELFEEDYEQTGAAARKALATKLRDRAREERSGTPARFVLLDEAIDLAASCGDLGLAFETVRDLESTFRIDGLARRHEALINAPTSKLNLLEKDSLAARWIGLLEEALEAERYTRGRTISADAIRAARKLRDTKVSRDVKSASDRMTRVAAAFDKLGPQFVRLDADPDHPGANLAIGSFYLFDKGDVEKGVSHLVRAPEGPLRDAATLDQAATDGSGTATAAADGWFALIDGAEKRRKPVYQERAIHWYRHALPSLGALDRERVTRRLEELGPQEQLSPVALSELATYCYDKATRDWEVLGLDTFAITRKSGVLGVKNTHPVLQFAYLVRKSPVAGDFVAELEVRGAIGVGLVSERSGLYATELMLKGGAHRVRITRSSGELEFWLDGRRAEPRRSRSSRSSRGGLLFVRVGKGKAAQVSRFAVKADASGKRTSGRKRKKRESS